MLTNKVTNGEMKLKVFFRRAREERQFDNQKKADYQYRESLLKHEFIEINEGNASAIGFKERNCILQLINLIEQGKVDTLYVYDASRLTRSIADYNQFQILLNMHKVRLVCTGSFSKDMFDRFYGLWEGNKIG